MWSSRPRCPSPSPASRRRRRRTHRSLRACTRTASPCARADERRGGAPRGAEGRHPVDQDDDREVQRLERPRLRNRAAPRARRRPRRWQAPPRQVRRPAPGDGHRRPRARRPRADAQGQARRVGLAPRRARAGAEDRPLAAREGPRDDRDGRPERRRQDDDGREARRPRPHGRPDGDLRRLRHLPRRRRRAARPLRGPHGSRNRDRADLRRAPRQRHRGGPHGCRHRRHLWPPAHRRRRRARPRVATHFAGPVAGNRKRHVLLCVPASLRPNDAIRLAKRCTRPPRRRPSS